MTERLVTPLVQSDDPEPDADTINRRLAVDAEEVRSLDDVRVVAAAKSEREARSALAESAEGLREAADGGTGAELLDALDGTGAEIERFRTLRRSGQEWSDPVPLLVNEGPASVKVEAVLPFDLASLVEDIARTVQVPLEAVLVLLPTALSAASGNAWIVDVDGTPGGWIEKTPARYAVTFERPGSRKSATSDALVEPLLEWCAEAQRATDAEVAENKRRNAALRKRAERLWMEAAEASDDEARKVAESRARDAETDIYHPPPSRLFTVTSTTPEALARKLSRCAGRAGVLTGEGREILEIVLGKYNDRGVNAGVLLSGHAGETYVHERAHDNIEFSIPRPAIALGLAVQTDMLPRLVGASGAESSGLLARMNLCWPRSRVGTRIRGTTRPLPNTTARGRWRNALHGIVSASVAIGASGFSGDEKPWRVLRFSGEALAALDAASDALECTMADGRENSGDLERMVVSKAIGEAIRLSALFHLFGFTAQVVATEVAEPVTDADRNPVLRAHETPISLATWTRAARHQAWQMAETLRCIRLGRRSSVQSFAEALFRWARNAGRTVVTVRDIQQVRGAWAPETAKEIDVLLGDLAGMGWLRSVSVPTSKTAARWEFHPIALEATA